MFELENMITFPKADVDSLFYKRKLTVYNLTAMISKNKATAQFGLNVFPVLQEMTKRVLSFKDLKTSSQTNQM